MVATSCTTVEVIMSEYWAHDQTVDKYWLLDEKSSYSTNKLV